METFQYIVMMIAMVILIISLIIIGLTLRRQKYNSSYPPVIANCPDYWSDTLGNNGSACKNNLSPPLGNASCGKTMDFSTPQWQGKPGLCSKYKWAKSCNMTWDGISNNPELCDR
jgi:hypothetical protein